jgi:hypothetical protein
MNEALQEPVLELATTSDQKYTWLGCLLQHLFDANHNSWRTCHRPTRIRAFSPNIAMQILCAVISITALCVPNQAQ